MGITQKSLDRLLPYIAPGMVMLELGAQNMYDNVHYGRIAKHFFKEYGLEHFSIDIKAHQEAEQMDLRKDLKFNESFDIVTNYGTLEHVDGSLYVPFSNIHDACNVGGIMVHENPKTGSWPKHGYHYFSESFYEKLAKGCGYEILEISQEPAMGNTKDGWNICAVLRKTHKSKFIAQTTFDTYGIRTK